MSNETGAKLVWHRVDGQVRLSVSGARGLRNQAVESFGGPFATVSNVEVPWLSGSVRDVLYHHPVTLAVADSGVVAGPVFAILAGSGQKVFHGNRAEYADLLRAARTQRKFVYVLPAGQVTANHWWRGYVRVGTGKWMALPCPRPEAIYNRIPTRNLERMPVVETARVLLREAAIPMFNPAYFNKAELYRAIASSRSARYLPETAVQLDASHLRGLLRRHSGVYLKPSGGSVGHGMMLAQRTGQGFRLSVMKNSTCQRHELAGFEALWNAVSLQRLPGNYVLQAAVPLIEWNERPCDFRVLLQKHAGVWSLVGKGVRVAGAGAITTHVPNGGRVAAARPVLERAFGPRASSVERALATACVELAHTVDSHYNHELGEMSMDIGIDPAGEIWFFEANSKPMKFDESDIRSRALQGVLEHLEEMRLESKAEIDDTKS